MASKTASLMLAAAKTAARLELARAAKTQAEEEKKEEEARAAEGDRRSASRSASYSRSERNRDRNQDRSRSRDRGRRRDSRSRSRSRDRYRERDRRRNRDDSRDRSRSRDRDRRRRRDDSRSRDRDRRRGRGDSVDDDRRNHRGSRRNGSRSSSRGRDGKPPAAAPPAPGKPATLTEIMAANPGISILDATKHLAAFNAAAASGLPRALGMVDHIRASSGGVDAMPDSVAAALGYLPPTSASVSGGGVVTTASGVPVGAVVRHQLHLSNIPLNVSAADLGALINAALLMTGAYPPGAQPVKNAKINHDYKFAFVDVDTDEDCLRAAEKLNGMQIGPCSIKIQKAKGSGQIFAAPGFGTAPISASLPPGMVPVLPGAGLVPVAAHPHPLSGAPVPALPPSASSSSSARSSFVLLTNISPAISEQDTRELVEPFGDLRGFNIIVTAGGSSRTAVFEYESEDVAAVAAAALSTLVIVGLKLSALMIPQAQAELLMRPVAPRPGPSPVLGASSLPPPPPPPPAAVAPGCSPDQALALEQRGGPCLVLSNMVGPEDLESDESCQDLIEDVSEECGKHGKVLGVKVPRSVDDTEGKNQGSRGLVYVKFSSSQGAAAAKAAVHGKRFAGKAVAVGYFPVDLFDDGTFAVPPGWLEGGL